VRDRYLDAPYIYPTDLEKVFRKGLIMAFAYVLFGIAAICVLFGLICIAVDEVEGLPACLFVAAIFAVCGYAARSSAIDGAREADVPHPSATQACSQASSRPMPVPATLLTTKDDRLGPMYPCNFLRDLGFAAGKPTALLGHINETVFTDSNFQAKSSWGGVLFFGVGGAGGGSSSQGATAHHDMYAFMAQAHNGAYTKFVVNSDSVQLATCERCTPFATMQVDTSPMFVKKRDINQNDSIWLNFPGGLRSPGSMLESLAHVVITLPSSLAPKPVA